MIRKIIYGVYAILGMMTMAACSGQSDASEISLEKMHGFPTENTGFLKGVSALYAGVIEGNLLIAGGCNFPDIPVADGGKKAYYRDIYIAPLSNDTAFEWKKIGQLPQAAAYGVTISTEKGLICVGGTTATHSLSDVFLLSLQKDTLKRDTLPSLPVTMDNMAGALVGHSLYIVGGNVMAFHPRPCTCLICWICLEDGKEKQIFRVNPEYNLFAWHKMENFMCGGDLPRLLKGIRLLCQ